ncbi:MAG: hypothetical protein K6B46_02175 [Opitutales bacterium]|nr:hypothetical protein [Opitutales bacterium]
MLQENFLSLVFDAQQLASIRSLQKRYKVEKISKLLRAIAENADKATVKKTVAKGKQITFRVSKKTFENIKKIAHRNGNNFSQLFRTLIDQTEKIVPAKTLKSLAAKAAKSVPEKTAKNGKKTAPKIQKAVPAKKKTKPVPAKKVLKKKSR